VRFTVAQGLKCAGSHRVADPAHFELPGLYRVSRSLVTARECSHCKRCISYGNSVRLSVRPSVRPSHAGIVSKRQHI